MLRPSIKGVLYENPSWCKTLVDHSTYTTANYVHSPAWTQHSMAAQIQTWLNEASTEINTVGDGNTVLFLAKWHKTDAVHFQQARFTYSSRLVRLHAKTCNFRPPLAKKMQIAYTEFCLKISSYCSDWAVQMAFTHFSRKQMLVHYFYIICRVAKILPYVTKWRWPSNNITRSPRNVITTITTNRCYQLTTVTTKWQKQLITAWYTT